MEYFVGGPLAPAAAPRAGVAGAPAATPTTRRRRRSPTASHARSVPPPPRRRSTRGRGPAGGRATDGGWTGPLFLSTHPRHRAGDPPAARAGLYSVGPLGAPLG